VSQSPSPQPSSSATGGKGATGTKLPKKTTTLFARDPFKALIVAQTLQAAPPVGTVTVGSGNGDGSGSGFTFPTSPSDGGTATSVPSIDGQPLSIELIRANGARDAVFDVGYAHNQVLRFDVLAPSPLSEQGTVFDGEFALLGIQDGEVTLQVGDDTPFDLRPGIVHRV
jgi:hypothetical protein